MLRNDFKNESHRLDELLLTILIRGVKSAAFGGALGFAALFFASGIPRVKRDILQVSKGSI